MTLNLEVKRPYLRSTGERVTILYTPHKDAINPQMSLPTKLLNQLFGSSPEPRVKPKVPYGYLLVQLPPQAPWHNPRQQVVREERIEWR